MTKKQWFFILGIPFCMWTIALAMQNESLYYLLLNTLLAIPAAPMIFSDLLNGIMEPFDKDMETSLEDAIDADRQAAKSELLNRKIYETSQVISPQSDDKASLDDK